MSDWERRKKYQSGGEAGLRRAGFLCMLLSLQHIGLGFLGGGCFDFCYLGKILLCSPG